MLILISAFFSASETSLFSLSRFQLRQLKQKHPVKFGRIRHLLDRPSAFVATVLLGNELANVLISNLLASFYEDFQLSPFVVTVVNLLTVLPLIMVVGEITPKVLGAKSNMALVPFLITPLWWFYRFSFPVRFLLQSTVELLTRSLRRRHPQEEDQIKEEDIRILLEDGKRKGVIHSMEQDIIENVFEIDDDKVIELATPLRDCLTVRHSDSPKSVIEKLNKKFYARIPVLGDRPNQVVGILYAKDLLTHLHRDDPDMKLRSIMKDPLVVEPEMKAEVLFRRFRQMKRHIAVVEDKTGNALAVITMEDILDQMFSELWEDHHQ